MKFCAWVAIMFPVPIVGVYQATVLDASSEADGARVANAQGWFNLNAARLLALGGLACFTLCRRAAK